MELVKTSGFVSTKGIKTGNKTYDAILAKIDIRLKYQAIAQYLSKKIETAKPATLALHKAALKAATKQNITDLRELAIIDEAFKSLKSVKPEKIIREEKILSDEKIVKVLGNATMKRKVVIDFLKITGCRISEMTNLKYTDCLTTADKVECRVIGKGKKERTVFISAALYREIKKLYKGQTYLFENSRGRPITRQYFHFAIKKCGELAGIEGIHPHIFRHTFATNKIKSGKTLKAVSQYLGHAGTAVTADMYCHDSLTAEDVL